LQQVIPGQHKSTGHQCAIGNKTQALETRAETPKDENRHHAYQRSELAQLDADVETNQIDQTAVFNGHESLKFGRKPEPVEQPENENCDSGVGCPTAEQVDTAEILEPLVDDRKTDDRVDDRGVHHPVRKDATKQRDAVSNRKKRRVNCDIPCASKEKHHPGQKEDVINTGEHVLSAKVSKYRGGGPFDRLDVIGVGLGKIVSGR